MSYFRLYNKLCTLVSQTGSPVLCIKMSDDLQMYAAVDKSKKNRNRKEDPPHNISNQVQVQTKDEYAVVVKSKKSNKKVLLMRGQEDSSFPPLTRSYKDDNTMSSDGTSGVKTWSDTVHNPAVPLQTKITSSEKKTPYKISLKNVDYKSPYMIACLIVAAVSIAAGMTIVITAFILIANLRSELLSTKRLADNLAQNRSTCNSTTRLSVQIVAGFYELRNSNDSFALLHCSPAIENKHDGLRKVADLNVNVNGTGTRCPPGFKLVHNPFSCRTIMNGSGCTSVNYSVPGLSYSYVTGKIIARRFGNPDAFAPFTSQHNRGDALDSDYVDGVSLTYGNPRNHIWTFAAGIVANNISCGRCNFFKPWFVGNNFSCEINDVCDPNSPYCNNPLWDGNQCVGSAAFYRELPEPASENIEMRVCRDQDNNDEDILLTLVELYVL